MTERTRHNFRAWEIFTLKAAVALGLLFALAGLALPIFFNVVSFAPTEALLLALQGAIGIFVVGTVLNSGGWLMTELTKKTKLKE